MPTTSQIKNIYYVISGEKANKIERLKAGFSNYSFLINHQHVLRIKKPSSDEFYNAKRESNIIKMVTPLNISETVVFFNENDGTKLSNFLPKTKKIIDQPSESQLILVAKTLRKLHVRKLNSGTTFDFFARLTYYKSQCHDLIDTAYERKTIAAVQRFYDETPFVLCHNDVVNGNLLFRARKVFLIDYEYAADNNPLFDLASFLSENDVKDEKKRRLFLRVYFGHRVDEKTYRHINKIIAVQDILWYYWSQMHYIRTKEAIYKRIAHHKWQAIKNNASSR